MPQVSPEFSITIITIFSIVFGGLSWLIGHRDVPVEPVQTVVVRPKKVQVAPSGAQQNSPASVEWKTYKQQDAGLFLWSTGGLEGSNAE